MRGEDDVRRGAADAVGEKRDEALLRVPVVDEGERCPPDESALQLLLVARDREPGVVRREHEPDDELGARRERRAAASEMRGVQCFMPVKTGRSSSSSSEARVASVIAFNGLDSSIPSRRYRPTRSSRFAAAIGRPPRMSA